MIIQEFFHVFEMRFEMEQFDHRVLALLKQQQERLEKFRTGWNLIYAMPVQCSTSCGYQANWEQILMWVDYNPYIRL